ncbi:MAG: UbiD family decarboxylase domain-containing protein [Candidatus Competibacteraceae bacterium]
MSTPSRDYDDLQAHLEKLKALGLLHVIDIPINKDRNLHPFVRWSYVSQLESSQRKGFYFTNVTDSNGVNYQGNCDVCVATTAGNEKIYAVSMGLEKEFDVTLKDVDVPALSQAIAAKWDYAFKNPVAAVEIASEDAPVHEIVLTGNDLLGDTKGLASLPIPNNTPGFDTAPYFSAGLWVTKPVDGDRENFSQNRTNVKASNRVCAMWLIQTGGDAHNNWVGYKQAGKKMPVALVVGAPPCLQLIGPQKTPGSIDDLDIAGGLVGAAIRKVKCKTVPLFVPADANIVIEGWIDPEFLEMEAPFGESHGYMSVEEYNHSVEVTAITRRKHAVITSMISQMAPSESGVIKRLNYGAVTLNFLKNTLGIHQVQKVDLHEAMVGVSRFTVIVFQRNTPKTEIWRGLRAATVLMRSVGKITVAVDEDIDPTNLEEVVWAIAYRAHPKQDYEILDYQANGHAPKLRGDLFWESLVMIDATLKYDMAPIALPKKEFMLEAKELWEKAGLPPVHPVRKWFGYSLGDWCDEWDQCARRAVEGQWLLNGLRTQRLVRTDDVGGPTAGVGRHSTVIYDETTGKITYPDDFPHVDEAIPDFSAKDLSEF